MFRFAVSCTYSGRYGYKTTFRNPVCLDDIFLHRVCSLLTNYVNFFLWCITSTETANNDYCFCRMASDIFNYKTYSVFL